MILFEYPLNERVRTLLRLEDLFARFDHFAARDHAVDHHAALCTLFEVLEVAARADLKSDLLQELERQRQTLAGWRDNPAVASDALEAMLADIDATAQRLNAVGGRVGQHLRDNEWLMQIRSRAAIPGGTSEFDLPSYHAWQSRGPGERAREVAAWAEPFAPLRDAIRIVLKLLRESAQATDLVARAGSLQHAVSGRQYQLLQVRLDPALGAIPEISANRHMLWIRFTRQDGGQRPRAYEGDVPFELALCAV